MTDRRGNRRRWTSQRRAAVLAFGVFAPGPAVAGEADVVGATITCRQGNCSVAATVHHGDTGWDHYADHWRIVTADGEEIGRRVLHHPHEHEQPFTRSLGRVTIPGNAGFVWIEAHDSVHGYGGKRFKLTLPAE